MPPPSGSMRITSAPNCAIVMPPSGAATKAENSTTRKSARRLFISGIEPQAHRGRNLPVGSLGRNYARGHGDERPQTFAPAPPSPQVSTQRDKFVERDPNRVVRAQRLDKPVAAWDGVILGGEGAEQAVEDDQRAAEILVAIFRVGGMVHAMVRGCVEHPFERPELWYPVGVQDELIEQVQVKRHEDGARGETEPHERKKERADADKPARPAKPERR